MSSTLPLALAVSAFVLARPFSGRCSGVAGEWWTALVGSGSRRNIGNPTALTTAHVNAATGMKRITPGALGGST